MHRYLPILLIAMACALAWFALVDSTPPSRPNVPTEPEKPRSSGIPTPAGIAGKTKSGRVNAVSGEVIENLHISTTVGPCVHVPPGVENVTIRDNEIGPCGSRQGTLRNEGVFIDAGASNVLVQRNVIHDISTALMAAGARHPIVFDRNFVYNIRGPYWQGQMVQFNGVRGGSGPSKITCNVKDGLYGAPPVIGTRSNEDHISMYNTLGNGPAAPIEIAYNRIRGNASGGGRSGSGMQLGDGENGAATQESGWYHVHDNSIVRTNGSGIAVAGGHDIRIENNRIDQRGLEQGSQTSWPHTITNFSANLACYNISFSGTQAPPAIGWAWDKGVKLTAGLYSAGGCTFTESGQNYDTAPWGEPDQLFDLPYAQCE